MWRREGGVSGGGGGDGGGGGGGSDGGGGGGVGVSRGVCGLARLTHSPSLTTRLITTQSVSQSVASPPLSHTHRLSHSHSVTHTVPSVRSDGVSQCG